MIGFAASFREDNSYLGQWTYFKKNNKKTHGWGNLRPHGETNGAIFCNGRKASVMYLCIFTARRLSEWGVFVQFTMVNAEIYYCLKGWIEAAENVQQ